MLKQKDYQDIHYFLTMLHNCHVYETKVVLTDRDFDRLGVLATLTAMEGAR